MIQVKNRNSNGGGKTLNTLIKLNANTQNLQKIKTLRVYKKSRNARK